MKRSTRQAIMLLTVIIMLVLLVTGCTRKDNLTGNDWTGITPLVTVADSFALGYSYTKLDTVSGSESYLLCGSNDGIDAMAVMRFTGFADTMNVIGQPVLKLVATRCSNSARLPVVLSFHKITQDWAADSTSNILDSQLSPLGIPDVDVDTVNTLGDTLLINLSPAIVQNWSISGVTGFNLAVKTVGDGWIEFKSKELSSGPVLSFDYMLPGATDTLRYSKTCNLDSYRYQGTQTMLSPNVLKLKNLLPQRMYVRFGLPEFRNKAGELLTPAQLKRVTINKAELVLFIKDTSYYNNRAGSFYPFNVDTEELITDPAVLSISDLSTVENTVTSYKKATENDSVKINITPLIQGYTSGEIENKGVVISSTMEMSNFGSLEFWHYNDLNVPADKKPYIKVFYTTALLGDD